MDRRNGREKAGKNRNPGIPLVRDNSLSRLDRFFDKSCGGLGFRSPPQIEENIGIYATVYVVPVGLCPGPHQALNRIWHTPFSQNPGETGKFARRGSIHV